MKIKKSQLEKSLAFRRYFGYSYKNKISKKVTRVKGIKSFVNFKYKRRKNLSPKQVKKINKYWDHIDRLLARPVTIYKSKSKSKLKQAQKYAGHDLKYSDINVAFVPVTNHKVKISVTKAGVSVKTTNIRTDHIIFDAKKLIKNPIEYVNAQIKEKAPKAKLFKIRVGYNGIYKIDDGAQKNNIGRKVAYYMSKYDSHSRKKDGSDHHWENWLHGLNAYYFKKQASSKEYFKAEGNRTKKLSKARSKIRHRETGALKVLGLGYGKHGTLKRRKK